MQDRLKQKNRTRETTWKWNGIEWDGMGEERNETERVEREGRTERKGTEQNEMERGGQDMI